MSSWGTSSSPSTPLLQQYRYMSTSVSGATLLQWGRPWTYAGNPPQSFGNSLWVANSTVACTTTVTLDSTAYAESEKLPFTGGIVGSSWGGQSANTSTTSSPMSITVYTTSSWTSATSRPGNSTSVASTLSSTTHPSLKTTTSSPSSLFAPSTTSPLSSSSKNVTCGTIVGQGNPAHFMHLESAMQAIQYFCQYLVDINAVLDPEQGGGGQAQQFEYNNHCQDPISFGVKTTSTSACPRLDFKQDAQKSDATCE